MIYILRITLAAMICLLQITAIIMAQKSHELARDETAQHTDMGMSYESAQTDSYKKSSLIFFIEESYNISQHATL